MNLDVYIPLFVFLPILGFIATLVIPERKEKLLSQISFYTAGTTLAAIALVSLVWMVKGYSDLNIPEILLYETKGYQFLIDLYFDKISMVYLLVGSLLVFVITIYSRYYLHRESGYKRFFNTIMFFYTGFNLTVLSGNFETLFLGWEILGLSSFLLIAFYRDRYLPVKNAVRVFSIYRIGDVGILLAMWASHHLWHENITFLKLNNYELVHHQLQNHTAEGIFIAVMLLIAAVAKSAQLPFSSWLPRAMEGPTPSSAIFYGSLSVHIGVFLLLRTYPLWENQYSGKIAIIVLGSLTAMVSGLIARVQSSVKSQIAYSSIAQIGLIFIEVALGWHTLALIHFASNAFLRTYQLLVSPSVVSYLIREQFYNFKPREKTIEDYLPKKLAYSFYVLSLKEWNLDYLMNSIVFRPLKRAGSMLNFLTTTSALVYFSLFSLAGIILLLNEESLTDQIRHILSLIFVIMAFVMVLKAFSERRHPRLSWLLLVMNHAFIAIGISFNEHFELGHTILYLSGVFVFGTMGYLCLLVLKKKEKFHYSLSRYHGHVYEHKWLGFMFLVSSLGIMGFPISTTFIGEDVILSHIHENQIGLALFGALSFIFGGIATIRIYARLFLGPHVKPYHETSFLSA